MTTTDTHPLDLARDADPPVGLGDDVQEAPAGTWGHRPVNLKHSIRAKAPVVMRLGVRQ